MKYITEYFGFEKVLCMNTGAEGVETAIKITRKWGYQKKAVPENQAQIIVCDNNFHGRTSVSYTHLRAHETSLHLVCRLLLEKKTYCITTTDHSHPDITRPDPTILF